MLGFLYCISYYATTPVTNKSSLLLSVNVESMHACCNIINVMQDFVACSCSKSRNARPEYWHIFRATHELMFKTIRIVEIQYP